MALNQKLATQCDATQAVPFATSHLNSDPQVYIDLDGRRCVSMTFDTTSEASVTAYFEGPGGSFEAALSAPLSDIGAAPHHRFVLMVPAAAARHLRLDPNVAGGSFTNLAVTASPPAPGEIAGGEPKQGALRP